MALRHICCFLLVAIATAAPSPKASPSPQETSASKDSLYYSSRDRDAPLLGRLGVQRRSYDEPSTSYDRYDYPSRYQSYDERYARRPEYDRDRVASTDYRYETRPSRYDDRTVYRTNDNDRYYRGRDDDVRETSRGYDRYDDRYKDRDYDRYSGGGRLGYDRYSSVGSGYDSGRNDYRGNGYDNRYDDRRGGYNTRYMGQDDRYDSGYDTRGTDYDTRGADYDTRGANSDSRYFRPLDETYRGTSGFDDRGRGHYYADRPRDRQSGSWGSGYDQGYASRWNYGDSADNAGYGRTRGGWRDQGASSGGGQYYRPRTSLGSTSYLHERDTPSDTTSSSVQDEGDSSYTKNNEVTDSSSPSTSRPESQ